MDFTELQRLGGCQLNQKIAIVDIETTGPSYEKGDKIIQIGCLIIENSQIIKKHSMLINPEIPIPTNIQHLTGIDQAKILNAPTIQSVVNLWYERLKDCIFVAHNINFDLKFLKEIFKSYDLSFNPKFLDTVILSKVLFPQAKGFNLLELSEHLQLNFENSHDALSDAEFTHLLLNAISLEIKQLDNTLKSNLKPFIENLPGNNWLVFEFPDDFMTHSLQSSYKVKGKKLRLNGASAKIQWIDHLEQNNPYNLYKVSNSCITSLNALSIIEATITKDLSIAYVTNQIENLLYVRKIASQALNVKLIPLLNYYDYIHLDALSYLVKHYSFHSINQQEIITIAATMNWVSKSETGMISELHKEFQIQDLMMKLVPKHVFNKEHFYYQKMIQAIQNGNSWIATNSTLIDYLMSEDPVTKKLFDSHLIIEDVHKYLNDLHFKVMNKLSITELLNLFIKLKEDYYDSLHHFKLLHLVDEQIEYLQRLISLVEEIMLSITTLTVNEHEHHIIQMDKVNKEKPEIDKLISEYLKLLNHLVNEFHDHQLLDIKEIKKIENIYKKWIVVNQDELLFYTASQFKQYFYDFEIKGYSKPSYYSALNQWLNFRRVSVYSSNKGKIEKSNIIDREFSISDLMILNPKHSKLEISLPLAYLSDDHSQNKQIVTFIEDNYMNQPSNIIILCTNKAQIMNLFQLLSISKEISTKFSLFAESITGSIHKINRRMKESENYISILKVNSYLNHNLDILEKETSVILSQLPFKSQEHLINQIKTSYLENKLDIFDQVILPDLVYDLKVLLTRLDEFNILNEVVIFDERILTKNYSYTLRKELMQLGNIRMVDNHEGDII